MFGALELELRKNDCGVTQAETMISIEIKMPDFKRYTQRNFLEKNSLESRRGFKAMTVRASKKVWFKITKC